MYKVSWTKNDWAACGNRWFSTLDAAIKFATAQQVAVIYDPAGRLVW